LTSPQDDDDEEKDLIAFELDLPTEKAAFFEAVPKVQKSHSGRNKCPL